MAGFWSMVGLVIKSLITGNDAVNDLGDTADIGSAGDDPVCLYAIARFKPPTGDDTADGFADFLTHVLANVPASQAVRLDQFFAPNPEATDPFQAMREVQLNVLNMGHRLDADAAFWGQYNANTGHFDVHLISDGLTTSLYDLLLPLSYSFRQPDHPDVAEALKILLGAQLVLKSRGGDQRLLQIARLSSTLEDFQERINHGEYFNAAGSGVALAYAFGAYMLSETGDRSYCASALRVLEPLVRQILGDAGTKPQEPAAKPKAPSGLLGEALHQKQAATKELRTEDLLGLITDHAKLSSQSTAVLALYGGLVNWSLISNLKARSGALASGLWKLLEHRVELSVGTAVDRAITVCKLGEALVCAGKDAEDAKIVDAGASQYRRAITMVNTRAHAPLYSLVAYGLAEAIVASANINDINIPDAQVVPVFQAALKVCSRRDQPYIWGRIMFALATVYLTNGNIHKDGDMLTKARMGFSQSYEAFIDAGAKGAARAASGGYTRTENMLSQLGHRKAVMDATGGEGPGEASGKEAAS